MKSLNKVQLIGNVGREPEIRATKTGTNVANFSLATSYKRGGEEATAWHRVTVWDKLAEVVEKYVTKGSRVYVEGRLDYREYEKDGVTVTAVDVVAHDIILLGENTKRDERRDEKPKGGLPF